MTAEKAPLGSGLVEELGKIPGLSLETAFPLAPLTTLRIGGPAELLAEVGTEQALARLVAAAAGVGAPLVVLGMGSNVLIPDQGVAGIVVRLLGRFEEVSVQGDQVEAGAAVVLARLARRCLDRGLVGLEALAGFPSTVGGAVAMNAGCYGTEIKDLLVRAEVVDREGSLRGLQVEDLQAGYRRTVLQGSGAIVVRALFQLRKGDAQEAAARMAEWNRQRRESLPSGRPNAGSIFKNPPGEAAGRLIEECGLKGARCGGAQISPRHANVIVNLGAASAADVLELMLRAWKAVASRHGVELEPELVLTGSLAGEWRRGTAADQSPR